MGCGGQKEEKVVHDEHDECGKKERKKRDKNGPKTDPDDGKYLRPSDADFQAYFDKYDLDGSESMNSHDEIRQLALNLLTSCLKIKEFKQPMIRERVAKLPEDTEWNVEQYKEWFYKEFNFSEKSVSDYNVLAHACKDADEDVAEALDKMKDEFGRDGQIGAEQVDDAFAFLDSEEFIEECNKVFAEAAGEDANEMVFTEFEDGFESFMTELLKETGSIGDDEGTINISKDQVKEWFELVDGDGSGKVSRGEFAALVKFMCINFKVEACTALHKELSTRPKYKDFNDQFRMGGMCHEDGDRGCFTLVRGRHQRAVGHFLCRVAFESDGDTYVKFKYQCNPREDEVWEADKKAANESCGEGLCVYLVDPEADKWDEDFNGEGECGFQGKAGGLFGVFLDLGGNISGKEKDSVCIKVCDPKVEECITTEKYTKGTGLRTKQKDDKWRKVEVKFNTDDKKCTVKIGGKKIIDDADLGDITLPKKICVGICAGTSKSASARFSVNDLSFANDPDSDCDESSDEE